MWIYTFDFYDVINGMACGNFTSGENTSGWAVGSKGTILRVEVSED